MVKGYFLKVVVFFSFLVVLACVDVNAQVTQYLNSNNIIAGIAPGGNLFSPNPLGGVGLFQTKFDSGRAEIFTSTLWMDGYDENGGLHGAAQGYLNSGYANGPLPVVNTLSYVRYYKRVFKVTQTEISQFRASNFPVSANQVDTSILYWPGKGNPNVLSNYAVSIDSPLAPFIDLNNNGIYEPLEGDYPAITGDQAIFFVFNDMPALNGAINCPAMQVEIRGLVSCFNDTTSGGVPYNKRAVNNSIFVQYQIENKSQHRYTGFDIGQWLDPDLGCFQNDYVGCDSARSLMFAYNGTSYDPDCSPELGFDSLPVALGVQLLSQPMSVFGISAFSSSDSANLDTSDNCLMLRNLLEGNWVGDSGVFSYGYTGYATLGYATKYFYNGDPAISTQWSEVSNHSSPGDRRMYGATDSLTFNPGQTIHFDVAFTTTFDSTSNNISIIDSAKNDADTIRQFYYQHLLPAENALGIQNIQSHNQLTVSLFPNPANTQVTIQCNTEIQTVQLMDLEGRVQLSKSVGARNLTLPTNTLARGVYLVNVLANGNTVVKKLVVE